ncbi:MAG: hypothetical protein LBG72_03145 [Spirochaetaceae bacterium]|nr:hypothetical protein [Spirochaetaceae bacterium]
MTKINASYEAQNQSKKTRGRRKIFIIYFMTIIILCFPGALGAALILRHYRFYGGFMP